MLFPSTAEPLTLMPCKIATTGKRLSEYWEQFAREHKSNSRLTSCAQCTANHRSATLHTIPLRHTVEQHP
jgi:hypothetical protein